MRKTSKVKCLGFLNISILFLRKSVPSVRFFEGKVSYPSHMIQLSDVSSIYATL